MMSRLLFEKTGESIYISHLDLMRVFQRAFRRAGLLLRHSQGFTPRAIVSIALPLALGTESRCELLDFELQEAGTVTPEQLNAVLPAGIRVLEVYEMGRKLKELVYLRVQVELEYDQGAPSAEAVEAVFRQESIMVEKQSKKGSAQVDIRPMIRKLSADCPDGHTIVLDAEITAQQPSLNPMLLSQAVETALGKADFVHCRRLEVLDGQGEVFR